MTNEDACRYIAREFDLLFEQITEELGEQGIEASVVTGIMTGFYTARSCIFAKETGMSKEYILGLHSRAVDSIYSDQPSNLQ